jgi:hypothetical protein
VESSRRAPDVVIALNVDIVEAYGGVAWHGALRLDDVREPDWQRLEGQALRGGDGLRPDREAAFAVLPGS